MARLRLTQGSFDRAELGHTEKACLSGTPGKEPAPGKGGLRAGRAGEGRLHSLPLRGRESLQNRIRVPKQELQFLGTVLVAGTFPCN